MRLDGLVHLADELVDLVLAVTSVTTLDEVEGLALGHTTSSTGELEGPEEVVGLLEVGSDGVDLVDQILHTDDTKLTKALLNDLIVSQGNTLTVNLTMTTLVDELTDRLQVGLTIGNVGLDELEHLLGGIGELDKGSVVDLTETEELHNLAGLGAKLVDTLDTDDKGELGLLGDVVGTRVAGNTLKTDLLLLSGAVLLDVGLGALEDLGTLGEGLLAGLDLGGGSSGAGLFNGLALLEDVLGDSVEPKHKVSVCLQCDVKQDDRPGSPQPNKGETTEERAHLTRFNQSRPTKRRKPTTDNSK